MDNLSERIYESDALYLEKYAALDDAVRRQRIKWEKLMHERHEKIVELEAALEASRRTVDALKNEISAAHRSSELLQSEETRASIHARQVMLDRASSTLTQREVSCEQKAASLHRLEISLTDRLEAVERRELLVDEREKALSVQRADFEASMAPSRQELHTIRNRLAGEELRLEAWKEELLARENTFAERMKLAEVSLASLRQERDADHMEQRCRLRVLKDEVEERELVLSARQVHAAQFELRLQELERQHNAAIEAISRRQRVEHEKQQQHLEQRFAALAEERDSLARERSVLIADRAEYLSVLQQHEAVDDANEPLGRMRKVQSLIRAMSTASSSANGHSGSHPRGTVVSSSPAAAAGSSSTSFVETQLESTIMSATTDDNRSSVKIYPSRRPGGGLTTIVRSPLSSEKKRQGTFRPEQHREIEPWQPGGPKQLNFA